MKTSNHSYMAEIDL